MTDKWNSLDGRNKLSSTLRFATILMLIFFLGACTMPLQVSDQPRSFSAQIVDPPEGNRITLGTTIDVQTRVSSPEIVTGVVLQANGLTVREDYFSNPAFHSGTTFQSWMPPAIGIYALQVILQNEKGQILSNVVTISVDEGLTLTSTLPVKTTTPITETPSLTPAPEKPQITADQNVNCRRGPSTAYPEISVLLEGQMAPISGRNPDSSWYYIDLNGNQCWVWGGAVTATGNVNDQPLVSAPPLPITKTPSATAPPPPAYSACHDYPDLSTCSSDPMSFGGCSWDTGMNKCQP